MALTSPFQRGAGGSGTPSPGDSWGARPSGVGSLSHAQLLSIVGITLYLITSVVLVLLFGFIIHSDEVFIWVLLGLLTLSLTDLRRWGRGVIYDWLPLGVLLVVYDSSKGISNALSIHTNYKLQIQFDELLFGKPLLTLQLQHAFGQTRAVHFWEYPMFAVYMTFFFIGLVVLAVLWRFAYPRFREFRAQYIVLNTLGFATYVLYPADPPWLVSQKLHLLPVIYRPVFEVWGQLGFNTANAIVERGPEFGNQTSAVPSMHAAVTLFVCLFFWPLTRRWWIRAIMVLYVLAMAFTLVYGGEHYVFDIVTGWLFAIVVVVGTRVVRRRRAAAADGRGTTDVEVRARADAELEPSSALV